MNSAILPQNIGNVCVGLASLLYALPLQYLLLELSRKGDEVGGFLAGLIVLIPMWLLLLTALLCVAISGGFDWLPVRRANLYALLVAATISLAVISALRLDVPLHPSPASRVLVGSLLHGAILLTIALATLNLNPRLASGLPLRAVNLAWTTCATLSLVLCSGWAGHRLVNTAAGRMAGVAHILQTNGELSRKNLARIPELDPQRDFAELLALTNEFQSRAVRDAAITKLRAAPGFVPNLVDALQNGPAEHALSAIECCPLAEEERRSVAGPARIAMKRITEKAQADLRYMPKRTPQTNAGLGQSLVWHHRHQTRQCGNRFSTGLGHV